MTFGLPRRDSGPVRCIATHVRRRARRCGFCLVYSVFDRRQKLVRGAHHEVAHKWNRVAKGRVADITLYTANMLNKLKWVPTQRRVRWCSFALRSPRGAPLGDDSMHASRCVYRPMRQGLRFRYAETSSLDTHCVGLTPLIMCRWRVGEPLCSLQFQKAQVGVCRAERSGCRVYRKTRSMRDLNHLLRWHALL